MRNLVYIFSLAVLLVACGESRPTKDALKQEFEKRELAFKDSKDMEQVLASVDSLVASLEEFEMYYPKDSALAEMYFVTGMACQRSGKGKQAVRLFEKAADEKFDGYEGAKPDQALYQIAYIFQEDIVDTKGARKYYRTLIKRYPNSLWTKFAKEGLETLGEMNRESVTVE